MNCTSLGGWDDTLYSDPSTDSRISIRGCGRKERQFSGWRVRRDQTQALRDVIPNEE